MHLGQCLAPHCQRRHAWVVNEPKLHLGDPKLGFQLQVRPEWAEALGCFCLWHWLVRCTCLLSALLFFVCAALSCCIVPLGRGTVICDFKHVPVEAGMVHHINDVPRCCMSLPPKHQASGGTTRSHKNSASCPWHVELPSCHLASGPRGCVGARRNVLAVSAKPSHLRGLELLMAAGSVPAARFWLFLLEPSHSISCPIFVPVSNGCFDATCTRGTCLHSVRRALQSRSH